MNTIYSTHYLSVSQLSALLRHPMFIFGVIVRIVLLVSIMPYAFVEWYGPFLQFNLEQPSLDPWSSFLSSGGNELAFPYGYVMWLLLLPSTFLFNNFELPLYWSYGITLMLADLLTLCSMRFLIKASNQFLLTFYWLSPIVLFATYWLGLNDIIPVSLLCLSLLMLKKHQPWIAGFTAIAAVSAKLSMLLALPFMLMYLFLNKSLLYALKPFLLGAFAATICFAVPFAFSSSGLQMLFKNPELDKVYQLSLKDHQGVALVFLLPLAYAATVYVFWSARRISFDLLISIMGIAFLLVLLITPAAPGWFIWVLPMLVIYQSKNRKLGIILVAGFSMIYILEVTLMTPQPSIMGNKILSDVAAQLNNSMNNTTKGLLHTILLSVGAILFAEIWRQMVRFNDYYRISRQPLVLGIAGDSGAGKDTLVDAIEGLFGKHSVAKLSGDDYHFWDRHKPMWQALTHLNPRANDLSQYANDLVRLVDGKSIHARHYDHSKGVKTKPRKIKTNDVIIASGLHSLYLPVLRDCYDLSIYLDIDEHLRRHFKIQRDVYQRGHSLEKVVSSLAKRDKDSKQFIHPQKQHADLILCLQATNAELLETDKVTDVRCKLGVYAKQGVHEEALLRVLIGLCGLHVDMLLSGDDAQVSMLIEGDVSREDIAVAAQMLIPNLEELLDKLPKWEDGMLGLMQLVVLSQIHQSLKKRML